MAADMSGEQIQAKITAARREAEGLKDKIKRRKDELADTTRKISLSTRPHVCGVMPSSHDRSFISCSSCPWFKSLFLLTLIFCAKTFNLRESYNSSYRGEKFFFFPYLSLPPFVFLLHIIN
jgi:hypothetical protein